MIRSLSVAVLFSTVALAQALPERFREAGEQLPVAQRDALAFLCEHMPAADRGALSSELLRENVRLAFAARAEFPWGGDVPDAMFDNYVLPYAQADESRERWRADMLTRCRPLVRGCESPGEAARALNEKLFDLVSVHYSTERRAALQAPGESIEQGKATCTGLSILLADACRSVCVPARLVSVRWPHKRGNHTWVEIWDGEAWRFCGADEPDPQGFDRAWFVGDAAKCEGADAAHRIYAVSFADTGLQFGSGWGRRKLWGTDETARYASTNDGALAVLHSPQPAGVAELANDLAEPLPQDKALLAQLQRYFAADEERQATFEFDRNLDEELKTKAGDARLRALVWRALREHEREQLQKDHAQNRVSTGGKTSPFTVKKVGERPAGGWPLVIAMHGGGGAPKRVNDAQWRHMQIYYKDHPEVSGYLYCALRAPTDEWNGFYTDYFYPLLEKLIRQFAVCSDVDTDRVIAIGYSHGGYGAFAIGPKMPHRFAAVHASAAAPTDGLSSPIGLHTLPFSFMVGGRDTAYGRRARCEHFATLLENLQGGPLAKYPTKFTLVKNNGHTGLPDRDLLKDLLPNVREAMPKFLAWEPTDTVVRDHYWLHAAKPQTGKQVTAAVRDNDVVVMKNGGLELEAWLDARLLSLDKPVKVVPGPELEGRPVEPSPSLRTLCRTMQLRGDPGLAASWVLPLK